MRTVNAGEQLFFDYGPKYWEGRRAGPSAPEQFQQVEDEAAALSDCVEPPMLQDDGMPLAAAGSSSVAVGRHEDIDWDQAMEELD